MEFIKWIFIHSCNLTVTKLHLQITITLGKWLKSISERQEKVEIISKQHCQEETTGQYLIQGEGNGKPLLWQCCLVHPQRSPGVLQTR